MLIEINCDQCNTIFKRNNNEVNRSIKENRKQFCSKKCFSIYISKVNTKNLVHNVSCAYCGKTFYKAKSKLVLSKSGLYFCCKQHKDLAQRIGGIKEIQPEHYRNGSSIKYRYLAFKLLPNICDLCGWNEIIDVLIVHHKDYNRENNDISNLQILCPTCHDIIHYKTKTGRFSWYS